jgi:hypothetical protein
MISSTLEHTVPEQMFTTDSLNPPEAVSTMKALQKASQQGQRIYHLTPVNMSNALPNINHAQETMIEITYALNAGKEVITHTDSISVPGWSGAGYIVLDPITGEGAYKISGGVNGGELPEGQDGDEFIDMFISSAHADDTIPNAAKRVNRVGIIANMIDCIATGNIADLIGVLTAVLLGALVALIPVFGIAYFLILMGLVRAAVISFFIAEFFIGSAVASKFTPTCE